MIFNELCSFYNRFFITEVLNKSTHPDLERILKEYRKPVVLRDDVLGELKPDKFWGRLKGSIRFQGRDAGLSVSTDFNDSIALEQSMKDAKKLMLALPSLEGRMHI